VSAAGPGRERNGSFGRHNAEIRRSFMGEPTIAKDC
jgi:hypothetical protein